MYGLVNRAVQGLVVDKLGEAGWEAVRADAGVEVGEFVGLEQYDDGLTYRLVGAASRHLGISSDEVLEAFGHYWVLFTGREGYGEFLRMGGADLRTFLRNLDLLHARVARSYPALKPPSFECQDVDEGTLLLHYRSTRDGLTQMVVGLVKGLGVMFQTDVEVEVVQRKSEGADHDVFKVKYEPRD